MLGQPLPRISVVTPSFNQARFLGQAMASVLGQGYPNLEYVVVDGGSSDGSRALIERHAARLARWASEPDGGQAGAINKGLAWTTGGLVAWLNADDFYLPGALWAVARAYLANPDGAFYYGDGLRVDEDGRALANFFPEGVTPFRLDGLVLGLNYVLQPAAFISRRHLDRVGGLDDRLRYGLDTDLWARLARVAAPVPVAGLLTASREYPRTKTATGSFARTEELRQVAERHSGLAMTPGALCYFLDTLHQFAERHPEVYPGPFREELRAFWAVTAGLMERFGCRPDGFPQVSPPRAPSTAPRPAGPRRFLHRVRRALARARAGLRNRALSLVARR